MADPSETTQVTRPGHEDQEDLLVAVRSLATQVGGLQAELHALRQETRGLPSENGEPAGWDEGRPIIRESPTWVRSVDSPRSRGLSVPWLLLEIFFLITVAIIPGHFDRHAQRLVSALLDVDKRNRHVV